jgi:hypothetical protein
MSKGHMEALAALKARKMIIWGKPDGMIGRTKPLPRPDDVTPPVTAKPGENCPTCGCKVPKRQTAAQRQRDSRARKKTHDQKAQGKG